MEKKVTLTQYVGFDTITQQIEKKLLKRGFSFNILLVGRSGLGKSTLLNTLFASHLIDSKGLKKPSDPVKQTTEISTTSHTIEENGVRLKLSITDTPGYVNNDNCWDPIVKFIRDQYANYLRKELTPNREKRIVDTRVHCVLFFINPSGHALTPLDITVMKKLSEISNVIPLIAKSDTLTIEERVAFKKRVKQELDFYNVKTFPFSESLDDDLGNTDADRLDRAAVQVIREMVPFAVVGSERNVVIDGKAVRGRRTRWGLINVENEAHCEFTALRNFLTRTHLQELIDATSMLHYESFRTKSLLALKETTNIRADV